MTPKSQFIRWYNNEFKFSLVYQSMAGTTEGSPHHRENSVGTHTDMVVSEYLARTDPLWNKSALCGAFAAAFHDVGKPPSKVKKFREDRGDYFAFHGHEARSARMWEDWAVKCWPTLVDRFGFIVDDIYHVAFMIEHHVPWRVTKNDKLNQLAVSLIATDTDTAFTNMIMSDTTGRISDDWDEKLVECEDWVEQFRMRVAGLQEHSLLYEVHNPKGHPVLFVPIGASGSGKTTFVKTLNDVEHFSLDLLRLEKFGEDYAEAFRLSTEDKKFRSFANERYREILRTNKDVVLDNTNVSRKARRFHITEARNRGYFIQAVLFPVMLQQVLLRQQTRTDKTVPDAAVEQQYWKTQMPQYGEFDAIMFEDSNLLK